MEKPTAKITVNCKNCNQENRFEVELSLIFDAIQRKHPSTKGPIESISLTPEFCAERFELNDD